MPAPHDAPTAHAVGDRLCHIHAPYPPFVDPCDVCGFALADADEHIDGRPCCLICGHSALAHDAYKPGSRCSACDEDPDVAACDGCLSYAYTVTERAS